MPSVDKSFVAAYIVGLLLMLAFWGGVIYLIVRVLSHNNWI